MLAVKWFHVLLFFTNISIQRYSFVCTQLNWSNYHNNTNNSYQLLVCTQMNGQNVRSNPFMGPDLCEPENNGNKSVLHTTQSSNWLFSILSPTLFGVRLSHWQSVYTTALAIGVLPNYMFISHRVKLVGWLVGFYGISTFVGYLTPNTFLCK